ncbi:MAG: SIMPL domain-containing protein [Bdellovibrionaceae bacterium]|nr:SIMPL domain-containing protein [Pseudobdellovibrionaceae bacterium]
MKMSSVVLSAVLFSGVSALGADRMVVVTGDCLRNLVPDRGAITLTAEALEKNPGAAMEKVSEHYNRIRERVKKMNLKNMELETTDFTVNEDIDWSNNQKKSRGFRARMGLRVTTSDTSKLGDLALIASELKVQDVSGLQHFVARETMQKEREACLQEAYQNARSKAEKLAKIAGQKLGNALYIQEDVASAPTPSPRMMGRMEMSAKMDSASNAPVFEAGTNKMTVGVQAGFELN